MEREDPSSSFAEALKHGDAVTLQRLLEEWKLHGVPFSASWFGWALRYATDAGHEECAEIMKRHGIVVDPSANPGVLLISAAGAGLLGVMRLITASSNDLHPSHLIVPLRMALEAANTAAAILLIDSGVDLNAPMDITRATPLIRASHLGLLSVVRHLLAAGASLQPDACGDTALILAASQGHLEVVRELINTGADVNHKSRSFRSALQAAAETGRDDVVALLLASGRCSIEVISAALQSLALSSQCTLRTAEALLQHGAVVNYKNAKKPSALTNAADTENVELMQLLLNRGADLSDVTRMTLQHKPVPAFLPKLAFLTRLDLIDTGPVPDVLYTLTRLTNLSIFEFHGELVVPPELSQLTNLVVLQLRHCGITRIPRFALRNMSSLRLLCIDGNALEELPLPPLSPQKVALDFDWHSTGGVLPHGWSLPLAVHQRLSGATESVLSLRELTATALCDGWKAHRAGINTLLQLTLFDWSCSHTTRVAAVSHLRTNSVLPSLPPTGLWKTYVVAPH